MWQARLERMGKLLEAALLGFGLVFLLLAAFGGVGV